MQTSALDLIRLRRDATLERAVLIENRARAGEDPHEFLSELPTIDELVVTELRNAEIDDRGLTAQYILARLAAGSSRPEAQLHAADANRVEREILRQIGLHHPELARTVWSMLGRLDAA
ncbi:hypothetical protein D9V32_10080 [Mycetocola tolaasinivorans]|uniref:Uncharacterized protein n=1 Tax=Mycetocola tolaasinivorans TaxID=76635 RepID=A0A3L7A5N2_9MICO|nr:hypothetical protein [Mycetocola tolaasinivorans]RLP75238.1 hypothetical protein D9V32_10080 [Mycetocola tolaasinivorans]